MNAWIARFDLPAEADGRLRVAVKDAIDIKGQITTAGSAVVRARAKPAASDARCLAGIRASSDAIIVGKTMLTEMCISPIGNNADFGMPVNPLAPDLIPGGSSSGSAVVVASGEADVALGTDTGGSVRIPAACCGIVGLKTTWGRIPLEGVWPLAPSLDTVGPMARDVAGVVAGMRLLEPGFAPAERPARIIGRLRIDGTDPAIDDAIDAVLARAGMTVREVELPHWDDCFDALDTIITAELWQSHPDLIDVERISDFTNGGLRAGRDLTAGDIAAAMATRARWHGEVTALLTEVELLALPTLKVPPPPRTEWRGFPSWDLTAPFNLAGVPALALPVPCDGLSVPAGLQLVGPMNGEDLLCRTGATLG